MIEALIAGERHPQVLADLARTRMRAKIGQLAEALPGHFGAQHAIVAGQIIDHIDFRDRSIAALTAQIATRAGPFERAVEVICSIPGIAALTAQTVIAEMGTDMSPWPTGGHCWAWAGLAPASHQSAGKHRPAGSRHGGQWLRKALIEAAHPATRDPRIHRHAHPHSRLNPTTTTPQTNPPSPATARPNPRQAHAFHLRNSVGHRCHAPGLPEPR
jgi:transposase